MKVTIKDKEITLKNTLRAAILYENITGSNIDYTKMEDTQNLITLFFCVVYGSAKAAHIEFDLTPEEMIDWLDEHDGSVILLDFVNWYVAENVRQSQLVQQKVNDIKEGKADPNF